MKVLRQLSELCKCDCKNTPKPNSAPRATPYRNGKPMKHSKSK